MPNLLSDVTYIEYIESCNGVLTIGKDGFIKLSDYTDLSLKKSFRISDMPLSCFAQLDEELFVVGGWDSNLHVFNMNYGSSIQSFQAHDDALTTIINVPSREMLITSGWDCTIRFWKVNNGIIDEYCDVIISQITPRK